MQFYYMTEQKSFLAIKSLTHSVFGPVDFTLRQSHLVTLSGRSGIGKSLFLRCIADIEPHQGEIYLENKAQQLQPPVGWRKMVSLLPADSQWWYSQVGQHFNSPDQAGLAFLGFEADVLEWSVNRLSSGEKQRLALLRMLQNKPKVLLLDEPSANVDPATTLKMESYICNYLQQHGAAALWVTHDPEQSTRIADRQYEFTRTAIIETSQIELS